MPKNLKKILIPCFTIILVFGVVYNAWAWNPFQVIYNSLATFINVIAMLLPAILLFLAAALTDAAIGFSNFIQADFVITGWTIIRDLVNVSFIFILLTIAFGTILRLPNYTIKKLLPKLIAVALLVNFSKMFCGMIIDATQILTHFFLEQGAGAKQASLVLMKGLAVAKIYTAGTAATSILAGVATTGWAFFAPMVINSIFNGLVVLIAAVVFGLIAGFFLLRICVLWFMVILSPAAFVCLVIPSLKKYWTKWWNTFLSYAFFAPLASFFIYLALIVSQTRSEAAGVFGFDKGFNLDLANLNSTMGSAFWQGDNIFYYITILGLLIGSVIIGKTLGVYGAAGVVAFGKKQGNNLRKYAWKKTKEPIESRLGQKAADWGERMHLRGMDKGGVRGWMYQQAARVPRKYAGKQRGDLKKRQDKYSSMLDHELQAELLIASSADKAAIMEILTTRGELDENLKVGLTNDKIKEYALNVMPKHQANVKKTAKVRLDIVDDLIKQKILTEKDLQEFVNKLKPGDMGNIASSSLKDVNVASALEEAFKSGALTPKHLARSAASDNIKMFNELRKIAESAASPGSTLDNYIKNNLDNALAGFTPQSA